VKIKTNYPFLHERELITAQIATFWDNVSEGWEKVWGPHIHHGFYENGETITPLKAQENLIEKLSNMLFITSNSHIVDVGCGMGGSSIYLAKKYHAKVDGITLSPHQVNIANQKLKDLSNVRFKVEDALTLSSFANNSIDIVWSLESCEQFYNKQLFVEQAYRILKPGGQLMLVTWCSDREEYSGRFAKKYKQICRAFDLPYMPTMNYYLSQLSTTGFKIKSGTDWSKYVEKSWDIGMALLREYSFIKILKMSGWRSLKFAYQLKLMRNAFRDQQVKYGVFLATKP